MNGLLDRGRLKFRFCIVNDWFCFECRCNSKLDSQKSRFAVLTYRYEIHSPSSKTANEGFALATAIRSLQLCNVNQFGAVQIEHE